MQSHSKDITTLPTVMSITIIYLPEHIHKKVQEHNVTCDFNKMIRDSYWYMYWYKYGHKYPIIATVSQPYSELQALSHSESQHYFIYMISSISKTYFRSTCLSIVLNIFSIGQVITKMNKNSICSFREKNSSLHSNNSATIALPKNYENIALVLSPSSIGENIYAIKLSKKQLYNYIW